MLPDVKRMYKVRLRTVCLFDCEIRLGKHEKKRTRWTSGERRSHDLRAGGAPAAAKRQTAMVSYNICDAPAASPLTARRLRPNALLKRMSLSYCIPLNKRVRGPSCKLRPPFFPIDLWPKREARARTINRKGKSRVGNLQYGPRNEVGKIFITSLYLEKERA